MKTTLNSRPSYGRRPPKPDRQPAAPPGTDGRHRRALAPIAGVTLALLALASSASANPCTSVTYDPDFSEINSPGVDAKVFVEEIIQNMADSNVKGYVATLTDRYGRTVAEIEQGLARTSCDAGGQRTFDTATKTPWGSVSKLLTTATVIRAAGQWGKNLDAPLVDHLPFRWRNQVHPRFKFGEDGSGPVTLRMMLQHRGGFRHSGCGGRTIKDRLIDGDLFNCAAAGDPPTAPPPKVGVRAYSNMIGIFQILLPYMHPGLMQPLEIQAQPYSNPVYDSFIQAATNSAYRSLAQSMVLSPAGAVGSCNMGEIAAGNPAGNYIMWYSSAADGSGQLPHDQNHTCASGAWIMSSDEMASMLYHLRHTDVILDRDQYALMEASWNDSLGWWSSTLPVGPAYSHNGAWVGTRAEVRSLPGGFLLTLVANSSFSNSAARADNAFTKARRKGLARNHTALMVPGVLL